MTPGNKLTVTILVAVQLPGRVYEIVDVPEVTPVTTPAVPTDAFPLLLVHVPPAGRSVSVIAEPIQTDDAPEIVPGAVLTVIVVVVKHPVPGVV